MSEVIYRVPTPTITELEMARRNGTLKEYLAEMNKKHREMMAAAGIVPKRTHRNGGIPKMVFHETRETEHSSVTDGLPTRVGKLNYSNFEE